jgi:cystathionine gamma-synthase/cystathionine gamma-lyase
MSAVRANAAIETLAIHAGQPSDPLHGAVMQPIVLASTFAQPEPAKPLRFDYSRSGNPTRAALEECLAALESGKAGFAFASGCAAATTLLHMLRPGDHVVCGDDVYGGTFRIFDKVIGPLGIEVSYVDLRSLDRLAAALTPRTRLVWLETPTNPLLHLVDLRGAAEACKGRGIVLAVDNTFASPVLQRPLELGATVVVHSTTKYINGHSDVVGGALITSDLELAARLKFLQNAIGAVPSPMDCYLVLRGIKTLPLRMRQHVAAATEIATRLERAEGVLRVHYPGLPSHPQHDLCRVQMAGGGGIITVELDGGLDEARRFLMGLRIFTLAESLGGVESLAEHPALMTHASLPPARRAELGITDGLVRLSIGIENVEELWADLEQALSAAKARL